MKRMFQLFLGLALAFLLAACSKSPQAGTKVEGDKAPLAKLRLQTDWFPQAEHGGFYQALAKGYYREEGLDVELLPGGPGAHIKPKIISGDAEFGMNPATDILVAASRGLPLIMVGAYLQHDHQALLLHADSPVKNFRDLDGKSIIASPSLAWIQYLKLKYGITINIQPVPYGLAQFVADKDAIRQCVLTNEPYLALQQGVRVRTLRLKDAGYDGYHVIFCSREYARQNSALVRAFVKASLRGWADYIQGDPEPAHRLILERNKNTDRAFLNFSRGEMILKQLVAGDSSQGEFVGAFSLARLDEIQRLLLQVGLIEVPVPIKTVATQDFSPLKP
jgi:NitT/TauT family transport system substrate-binding protein